MRELRHKLGSIYFWTTWPLIYVYVRMTRPRARVLILHEKEVLVVKNWFGPGTWALPGGGVQRGEDPKQAAIREVQEEVGVTLDPKKVKLLGNHISIEAGGLKSSYYLFTVRLKHKPTIRLQDHEIIDSAWINISELQEAPHGVSATVKQTLQTWMNS